MKCLRTTAQGHYYYAIFIGMSQEPETFQYDLLILLPLLFYFYFFAVESQTDTPHHYIMLILPSSKPTCPYHSYLFIYFSKTCN